MPQKCYNLSMKTLLSLDLSTKASGWALFDITSRDLIGAGVVTNSVAGFSKLKGLELKLAKIQRMVVLIQDIVTESDDIAVIVIEEITGSKNRLSQKTLDFLHYAVLESLHSPWITSDRVRFIDVGGKNGWRPFLGIRLNDGDKKANKIARRFNKKHCPKGSRKIKELVIGWKDLSCRYASEKFGLELLVNTCPTDGDVADAICVGYAFLLKGDADEF